MRALALGMIHVLFAEGYADRDYMARYADDPAALEAHVRDRTPEWAEGVTGVPAETIRDFARLYGRTKRAYHPRRLRLLARAQRRGLAACRDLPADGHRRLGAQGRRRALFQSLALSHRQFADRRRRRCRIRSVRELDQSRLGAVLTGDKRDLGDGPPVTAMIVQNTNPMMVCPNTNLVRQGLSRDDLFLVRARAVHDRDGGDGGHRAAGHHLPGA